jgi:hypothetical protein
MTTRPAGSASRYEPASSCRPWIRRSGESVGEPTRSAAEGSR